MKKDWLLRNQTARHLYEAVARDLPIVDYHNHLSVKDLADNRTFETITQLWITPDPYKHRAMRILGVEERLITGNASDFEKWQTWLSSLPKLIGTPLYDWSRMEFEQVFGLDLFAHPVQELWETVNQQLSTLSAQDILNRFPIAYCAPCASLCDDLSLFEKLDDRFAPSLRADDLLLPSQKTISELSRWTNLCIDSLNAWEVALDQRLGAFVCAGCCYTDHALDNGFCFVPDDGRNAERFDALLAQKPLSLADQKALSSFLLTRLAGLYAKHGLNMQLHIGAQRSTSTRLREIAGAAGGYAAIGSTLNVSSLTSLLDAIEQQPYGLPKTLLFALNPSDNAVLSTLSGSYSKDGVEAIVSQGPAWWWCDHYQGMRTMLEHLAGYGVLSTFVGMTTDSRSLLSFVRHDYFRRILCDWIGEQAETVWELQDPKLLYDIVKNMCYQNAAKTVCVRKEIHE